MLLFNLLDAHRLALPLMLEVEHQLLVLICHLFYFLLILIDQALTHYKLMCPLVSQLLG